MQIRIRSTGAIMYDNEFRQYVKDTTGGSFDALTSKILEDHDADPLLESPRPQAGRYQFAVPDGAEQKDGQWFTKWKLIDLTDEQKAIRDAEQSNLIRTSRDQFLSQSDWTQMPDNPLPNKEDWAKFRQALRDVPTQTGFPWNVNWPVAP